MNKTMSRQARQDKLTQQYKSLDPIAFKKQIKDLQEQLWQHA